jgi:hypothetical protein
MNEAIAAYLASLASANLSVWEWQKDLVRRDGYTINSSEISREALTDSTLWGVRTKRQTVHRYQDFETSAPHISVSLDNLEGLTPDLIMQLLSWGFQDLEAWGIRVFGDGTEGSGEFTVHKGGDPPRFRTGSDLDTSRSRDANVLYHGSGEIGKILLDFQWNSMVTSIAWAEAAAPWWDKPLWYGGGFIDPLTVRSASGIAVSIAAGIVTMGAGTFVTAAIMFAMNTANDLLFTGVLDGDMASFGKNTAVSAVTSAASLGTGAVLNKATTAMAGGTALVNATAQGGNFTATAQRMAAANGLLKTGFVQGGIKMAGTYATSMASNYTMALTGQMSLSQANASWGSASTIGGALGAGVTQALNTSLSEGPLASHMDNWGGVVGLGAAAGGELVRYGVHVGYSLGSGHGLSSFGNAFDDMGGVTVNLLSTGTIAQMLGMDATRANKMSVGLFELNIGSGGLSSRFGTGGIDISAAMLDISRGIGRGVSEISARMAERQQQDELLFEGATEDNDWLGRPMSEIVQNLQRDLQLGEEFFEAFGIKPRSEEQWLAIAESRNIAAQDLGSMIGELTAFIGGDSQALSDALINSASKYLGIDLDPANPSSQANAQALKGDLNTILDGINSLNQIGFSVDPTLTQRKGWIAVVDFHEHITLDPHFFTPAYGDDKFFPSRSGILIHEVTHFRSGLNTRDITYRPNRSEELARNNPSQARTNASNWEFFHAEYIRQGGGGRLR